MASKNNINSVFTDIANSIRAKKGTTNTIQPINMAEEIDGIITGIDGVEYIEGSITLAESALVNTVNINKVALTIDFSRDSYDHVINVNSADTSINVNNGQTDITNNESGVINLDNKGNLTIASNSGNVTAENLTPENIKEGVSILGKVGTFKGGSSEDRLKKLLDATKSAKYLFYNYTGTSVDDLIQYSDTENVTNMEYMFKGSRVKTIPLLNTSNVTTMNCMFESSSIQEITNLDTSKVQYMNDTFSSSSITKISLDNDCYQMVRTFIGCSQLTSINISNSNKLINANSMCSGCTKLITLAQINMKNTNETYNMLYNCKALTNLTLLNIKVNLTIGSGTSYGHLLTLDSLINTIKELVNVGASRKLTMGSANLEKIANVYVKRTTTGDIPTCLSDNSNIDLAKAPCEVCESTDEGAMTLEDYANLKSWELQ